MSPALRGFKSHLPHHNVEIIGGFVRVMLNLLDVFRFPEDITAVIVFAGHILKAGIN